MAPGGATNVATAVEQPTPTDNPTTRTDTPVEEEGVATLDGEVVFAFLLSTPFW